MTTNTAELNVAFTIRFIEDVLLAVLHVNRGSIVACVNAK